MKKNTLIIVILIALVATFVVLSRPQIKSSNSSVKSVAKLDLYNTQWSGEYISSGDSMHGELKFDKQGYATFTFKGNENSNQNIQGSYTMNILDLHKNSGYIYLSGVQWIDKPNENNWYFNKLIGGISDNFIVGAVVNEDDNTLVGTFEFKKVTGTNK